MTITYKLSQEFHAGRRQALIERVGQAGLDLLMVFDPTNIAYLSGFFHITTERPIGLGFTADGQVFGVCAALEVEQLQSRAPWLTDVETFFDYPQGDWDWVARRLAERGFAGKRVGVDLANLVMGDAVAAYESFRGVLGAGVGNGHAITAALRQIKQPEEIAITRLACQYCDFLVGAGFTLLKEGVSEYEVHRQAEDAVIKKMLTDLPEIIDTNGYVRGIVMGRTLFGGSSSLPHGPKGTARLRRNSVVMITYGTGVSNYVGETERSGFFGERRPIDETRFQVMLEAQTAGIEAIGPGVRCCDVWQAVADVVQRHGMADALRHHAGHGKGMEPHEPPFLDPGDETVLQPGMLLSCEPGLYFPGEAGFRHSDTILVTESGREVLTRFPRDMKALTVPLR
ncbi:MAG: aminopeptidase P family protein [Chloroflexi bacterium]|nr:aminopeptidase P family protein [Chloroflexota bacterium]